jgi:hypothetical protein
MERRRFIAGALTSTLVTSAGGQSPAAADSPQHEDWARRRAEMERTILESFPYPIVRVPGTEAFETWERLRRAPGVPVALGGEEDFLSVAESVYFAKQAGKSPASILEEAARFTFPDDFRARLRREEVAFQEQLRTDPNTQRFVDSLSSAGISVTSEPSRGPWPKRPPADPGFTIADQLTLSNTGATAQPHSEVIIATLPTQDWTEAFAYLAFGGWNSCPHPHEQIAAFRYWSARHELILAGLSGDVLNLRVSHPPRTRDGALDLAREQYEFCQDIVDQGVETLDALAAGLMANDWWYFWWD